MASRFPSRPLIIRVPFFPLFGFDMGTQKEKGQKGTTGEPGHSLTAPASLYLEGNMTEASDLLGIGAQTINYLYYFGGSLLEL